MSHHNKEFPRQAELTQSLKDHGLNHKSPSQLADAFRFGWRAALALATPAPAQPEPDPKDVMIGQMHVALRLAGLMLVRTEQGLKVERTLEATAEWAEKVRFNDGPTPNDPPFLFGDESDAPSQPEPKGTTLDEKSPAKGTTSDQSHQPEGQKTGWPPGMLQDDDRKLSRALAGAPHARAHADEAAAAIKEMERIRFAAPTSPTPAQEGKP